jgi:hypothetical protein
LFCFAWDKVTEYWPLTILFEADIKLILSCLSIHHHSLNCYFWGWLSTKIIHCTAHNFLHFHTHATLSQWHRMLGRLYNEIGLNSPTLFLFFCSVYHLSILISVPTSVLVTIFVTQIRFSKFCTVSILYKRYGHAIIICFYLYQGARPFQG